MGEGGVKCLLEWHGVLTFGFVIKFGYELKLKFSRLLLARPIWRRKIPDF